MRTVIAIAAALAVALSPVTVQAFCGFYVAGADTELYNNATMVVMMREGTRTVLSMQNNYEGPPQNFAMVVPVPEVLQEENVKTLSNEVFDRVDQLAAPRLVEYWEQDPCQQIDRELDRALGGGMRARSAAPEAEAAEEPMVTIEAEFEVGEYDIVILSANDSTALDTWLRQNGYDIPEGAAPILRPYVEGGMKFFVAKVSVERVTFEDGQAMLSPLRFHYDSEDFSLPVRLGLLNSKGKQDLIVHILAPGQRYELANYQNVTIPTNLDVADSVRQSFGAFYAALFDRTLEQNPGAIVTEYAWQATNCDPCPGPVLSASDITTLGGDVLPSTGGDLQMRVNMGQPTIQGSMDQNVANAVMQSGSSRVQSCMQAASDRGTAASGSTMAQFSVGTDGRPTQVRLRPAMGDAELRSCLVEVLEGLRFPPASGGTVRVSAPILMSVQPANPWEVQQRMASFVLTRLHARYSPETLENDLVFKPAEPIVGGREHVVSDGSLEKGAQPSSANNFQGRYAIRHPWDGPITCSDPVRGVWGGPPGGIGRDTGPQAAQDLAFAPRGEVRLVDMLKEDVPELDLTAAAATQVAASGEQPEATGTGGAPGTDVAPGGDCDCRVTAGRSSPLFALAFVGLVALALLRRRQ